MRSYVALTAIVAMFSIITIDYASALVVEKSVDLKHQILNIAALTSAR